MEAPESEINVSHFEFVSVFIAIVVAFAVSDILASWGEQIRLRGRIRTYALHTAWSGLLLIVLMGVWWSLWMQRERTSWTFPEYLMLMVPYLTLALIAYILTPRLDDEDKDIKQYYFDNSAWIFSLAALYLASWIVFSTLVSHAPSDEKGSLTRLAGLVLMVALAVWRNEYFHIAAVTLSYVLLFSWIGTVIFSI